MAHPPRGLEPVLVHALRAEGARELRPDGMRVLAIFRVVPSEPAGSPTEAEHLERRGDEPFHRAEARLRLRVEARLRAALPGQKAAPRWRPFDGDGWLAARGERQLPLDGHPPLRILPGVAFGDGDHPTTRRCLEVLVRRVRPGDRVADVGAGSGILAVAAARLGARPVLAVEMDPAGCLEVEANARLNGVEEALRLRCHQATPEDPGLDPGLDPGPDSGPGPEPGPASGTAPGRGARSGGGWHGIVANLEGPLLASLLPAFVKHLAPGGWLLVSGLLAPEVEALPLARVRVLERHTDDGWITLLLGRESGPSPGSPPMGPGA